ncbi:hypothetical protein CBR_g50344 [Chara braunii]|uniref:Uncharacterized protein n=1 Tax=Chara braunii TaxID=69332 RepID=A0A388K5T1_CHABU|nr:hypothetical protein CBR_g50344 [Chara braunii]|eukprot:GBG65303.1 hypothetical protein CBR_g50344 [Chara braunii]
MSMAASCVAGSGSVRAVAQQSVTASSSSSATAMATATAKGDCLSPSVFCAKLNACQNQQQQQPLQGSLSAARHVSAFRSKSTANGFAVQLTVPGTIDSRRPLTQRRWPSSSSMMIPVKATTDNVEAAEVEAAATSTSGGDGGEEECNDASCAPEKEVGKVSLSWEAQEKTKVTGTFPPMSKPSAAASSSSSLPPPPPAPSARVWTGYVEKDTAGQTNIYSVEPTVYVSDQPMSSTTLSAGIGGLLALLGVCGALLFVATSKPPPTVEPTSTAPVERLDKGSGRSEVKRARALGLNLPEDFPEAAPEPVSATPSSSEPEAADLEAEAPAEAADLAAPVSESS